MAKAAVANDKHPLFADEDTVEQYLEGVEKAAWLQCREVGHDFRYYRAEESDKGTQTRQVIIRIRKCRRCTTKRFDTIVIQNRRAHVERTKYEHPEGYLLAKGNGRIGTDGRDMIRHQNLLNEMRNHARGR